MENKIISQLVENTGNLILNNQQLVKNNELALQIIEHQQKNLSQCKKRTKELTAYLKQEHQTLTDKKKRSIQEENQYQFITKLLIENR